MKILVCISNVPDTTSKINFLNNDTQFDTNGIQWVINPHDEYSLTRAMWFKEQQGASVTVVNVGSVVTEQTLRKALAIGADDAIRVNAEPQDGYFVAQQLAEVVKNGGYDLILAGRESIDYNGGMVPGMLATLLGYNFVNAVNGIEVNGDKAKVTREIDGGKEIVEVPFPLVIGAQKGIVEDNDLRIPNMRGIMTARTKPLQVLEPTGNDEKSVTENFERLAPKAACKIVGTVDELIDLLHNEAKII
jgi:electron transfer flavoprotein beta subunit